MKHLFILCLALLITACGTSKQVRNETEVEIESEIENKIETETVEQVKEVEEQVKIEVELEDEVEFEDEDEDEDEKEMIKDEVEKTFNHKLWNDLLQELVSDEGNVNYNGFRSKTNRNKLRTYIKLLIDNVPDNSFSREDKLAYWINAYNALTVDLILRNYPLKSIKDIKNPWDQRLWKFGNKWENLNDIEHKILRKMNEPRIHFGIVCASFSCPKLQNEAFTTDKLETQLTKATKEFLADPKRNSITQDRLQLSKIFQWFAKDFKQNGTLIDFLNQYSEVDISPKAKKSYKTYNWDLND